MLAVQNLTEPANGVRKRHVAAGNAGEHLSDEEWLRQELLYATRTANGHTVLVRKFLDAEDSDHVLKVAVALQNLLHFTCHAVMLFSDDAWLQNSGV